MQPISQPIKLGRYVEDLCDCGQRACWEVWIPVGKLARPCKFKLCDDCLELENSLHQPRSKPVTP